MRFRKKPVVIEAIRWEGSTIGLTNGQGVFPPDGMPSSELRLEMPAWMPPVSRDVTELKAPGRPREGSIWRDGDELWVGTLEGSMIAKPGDWIIRGVKGEIYPCKPDIFMATYDRIDNPPDQPVPTEAQEK